MPLSETGEDGLGIVDVRADLEKLVMLRHDLRCIARIADELSGDQRLILACQLLPLGPAETCVRLGWSSGQDPQGCAARAGAPAEGRSSVRKSER